MSFGAAQYFPDQHVDGTFSSKRAPHLEDYSALKDNEHEESEYRVIPILVQAPQPDRKELEDEEGGDCMLCKQFPECGDWYIKVVFTILPLMLVDDSLVGQAMLSLVVLNSECRVVARIGQTGEGVV